MQLYGKDGCIDVASELDTGNYLYSKSTGSFVDTNTGKPANPITNLLPSISDIQKNNLGWAQTQTELTDNLKNPIIRKNYVNAIQSDLYKALIPGYTIPALRKDSYSQASDILTTGLNVPIEYDELKNTGDIQSYKDAGVDYTDYNHGGAISGQVVNSGLTGDKILLGSHYYDPKYVSYDLLVTLGHEGTHIVDMFDTSIYFDPLMRDVTTKVNETYDNTLWDQYWGYWSSRTESRSYQYEADLNKYINDPGQLMYKGRNVQFITSTNNKKNKLEQTLNPTDYINQINNGNNIPD